MPSTNSAVVEALRVLIPKMREDAAIHRTWTTEAARQDLDGRLGELIGNVEWHEYWAAFYDEVADTMERAADLLTTTGRVPESLPAHE